jgi:hypothetical protein
MLLLFTIKGVVPVLSALLTFAPPFISILATSADPRILAALKQ